jgi:hypothetical protein
MRIFSLLLVVYLTSSFAIMEVDEFSVIKVFGSIKHSKNQKALFTGDKVLSNERLTFGNETAKAALISKQKGRFMLNPSATGVVKEGLLPAMNNVASRAGALLNALDVKKHYSEQYLILSGYEAEISETAFPIDEQHFFFIRFTHNGEEISKKPSMKEGKLCLKADELLKVDNKSISLKEGTTFQLIYRNQIEKTSEVLAQFVPVFPNEKNLVKECKLILSELDSNVDQATKKEQILAYLVENYGKPHPTNFEQWVKQNLAL